MPSKRAMRTKATLVAMAVFGSLCSAAVTASESRTYDWLTAGTVSGSHVLLIKDDGTRVSDFEFNDRGRGPRIHELVATDEAGLPLRLEISGHSYMGAPAEETLAVADGIARWKSTLEEGSAAAGGFYSANDGTPEQLALLARALLSSDSGSLDLLPAGRAAIERVTDLTVPAGDGEQEITLYRIGGLDLTPNYLWLDEDRELFALTLGWMGLAPRGRGELLPRLQEIQDAAEKAWHRQLAERLTQRLPAHWILRNVDVIDVTAGRLLPDRMLFVRNGRIEKIAEDRELDLPVYGDLEPRIIDGQGLTLMPGLWDMHTHLSLESGLLHIAAGVTTVRDLGNDPDRLREVRGAFDRGEVIGPRSVAAGFIDRKSPYSAPTGRLAESLDDALAMVADYAQAGYPQIKLYSSIEPGWVRPLAEAIHGSGMRVSGHIPSFMTARQAVLDGYDEIQHINMLFLNFLAGPEDDTRTPLRFSLVAEKAGGLDLDSPPVTGFVRLLQERGTVVDPTVTIFDSMFRHRSGETDPSYAMVADHMPPSIRRSMLGGRMDINEGNRARYAASADALVALIGKLHADGVPLVAGTDAMAGFTLHRELELYRRAGISNADVLRIATLQAAGVAGRADRTGSIEVGKAADFVLLEANPLDDISAVRRPVAVFTGERWYDPALLYEAVGIRPFTR
ncbi:MAG: amidohydrolase family protein [Xanthomonadales bacterium]|nr:amidohydrolase family protein [Xanthomonadales bacterium]